MERRSTYYYEEGSQFLIEELGRPTALAPDAGASVPAIHPEPEYGPYEWASWGASDDHPELVKKDVEANPVLGSALKLRKAVHYGKGLVLYREEIVEETGKMRRRMEKNPEVMALLRNSNHTRTQPGFISDHETFGNIVPVVILNAKGKIVQINRMQAYQARWQKMDENGVIGNLYLSANFRYSQSTNKPEVIPALDHLEPMMDLRDRVKNRQGYMFALPTRIGEMGQIYYELPAWDGLREGWLKIVYRIPRLKQALLTNQMRIRYHVQIPFDYYRKRFKDWDSYDQEKQDNARKTVHTEINKWLAGEQNAGKTLLTHFETDGIGGKELPGIKITPIQDTFKEGEGLMDASAGNTEVLAAMQVDPILIGVLPGTSQQGSGSSKREAFTILQASMSLDREATLYPWRFAMQFNGMDPELEIGYRDVDISETLNENPTGKKEVI